MWTIEICGNDGTVVQRHTHMTKVGCLIGLHREAKAFDAPHLSFTFWEAGWKLRVQGPRGQRWSIGNKGGWYPLRPNVGSPAEAEWVQRQQGSNA